MWTQIQRMLSSVVVVGLLIVGLLGSSSAIAPSAQAAVQQLEEAPGQILYQTRHKLRDTNGNTWQAIAFKRIHPGEEPSIKLRLVGFPGTADLAHPHPLAINIPMGITLSAADISTELFTNGSPVGNVGQYDLTPIIDQIPIEFQSVITLDAVDGSEIRLVVAPLVLHEWQDVAEAGT